MIKYQLICHSNFYLIVEFEAGENYYTIYEIVKENGEYITERVSEEESYYMYYYAELRKEEKRIVGIYEDLEEALRVALMDMLLK